MNKRILISAALIGLFSIILGAFGAHGLKDMISSSALQSFETGVRYQIYHALLLLWIGGSTLVDRKNKSLCYYLILIGILFFSGSIYGLSTNTLTNFDFTKLAFLTPIGGLLLIIAWIILLINFLKIKVDKFNF